MTEEAHTPVYLTRYQLKKSQQHQTDDEKITTPRNKSVSTSKSLSSAKFSRKVEALEKTSSEPKRRRKVSSNNGAKRRAVVKSKTDNDSSYDSEVKGKCRTRRINMSPDTANRDTDSSQLLLMPGLEFLFGGLLEEANSRLSKRASKKTIKKGDQIEAKLKGWAETFNGEIHSVNEDKTYDIRFDDGELRRNIKRKEFKLKFKDEDTDDDDSDWGDIEGKPEEVEYTQEEHSYISKLDKSKQGEIMYLENEILKIKKDEKPIRFKILELDDLSPNSKANIISKIDHFYSLDSSDNEYHKLSTWVETLERMPFGKYIDMPVKADSSIFEVGNFLCNTREILDKAVFGHNEAKDKIITTIAKQISNPSGGGTCIGIQGPPGNGKTTLVKEGICKAMKRPFSMVALGGMQDSSFMMGHEYTYEGSKPGRIIEILGESGCMNPVIYFDELDKISKTQKGEEIENFLCHLTDSSQNTEFHDKYMSGINFDLSKATFIFSYNDPKAVNPILLDRIYKIKTDGFTDKSKLSICKDYLLPSILEECNFTRDDIKFTDNAIKRIIQNYTDSEKGVRNLKRSVETIVAKINVLRYMYPIEPLEETETVKEELKSEVLLPDNDDKSPEKVEINTILETIIETAVSKVIEVKSNTSDEVDNSIGIKLTVSEKIPELTSELNSKSDTDKKTLEAKPEEPIKKEFTADKIMESKIKKFTLPYEVNEDNLSKFITSAPYNPSIAHLYL